MADVTLWHGVEYEVEAPVAIEDLIKSLEAHTKLLHRAGDLITALFPGVTIEPKSLSGNISSDCIFFAA